jgi:IS5 family transposase
MMLIEPLCAKGEATVCQSAEGDAACNLERVQAQKGNPYSFCAKAHSGVASGLLHQ